MPASPERIAASDKRMKARFELIRQGICPECQKPMYKAQSGQHVVAMPCGHELYVGKL